MRFNTNAHKILALLVITSLAFSACHKDLPGRRKFNKCKQTGTISHLPMFCGTPPVVYQTGIKDLDGNFFQVRNDLTGDFDNMKLGDTVGFTMVNLNFTDPLRLRVGDLTCMTKLADAPLSNKAKMLVLKVDHETYKFEGAHEYLFHRASQNTDTIPISMYYNPPGDFGSVEMFYQPTGETFFAGTIIWMGLGKISTPHKFNPASAYSKSGIKVPVPGSNKIQQINHPREAKQPLDVAKVWSGIEDLDVVKYYMNKGAHVGIYKYTPSVGIGDPNDWDYMVFLHYKDLL